MRVKIFDDRQKDDLDLKIKPHMPFLAQDEREKI